VYYREDAVDATKGRSIRFLERTWPFLGSRPQRNAQALS
jgi:hypothetical protein